MVMGVYQKSVILYCGEKIDEGTAKEIGEISEAKNWVDLGWGLGYEYRAFASARQIRPLPGKKNRNRLFL